MQNYHFTHAQLHKLLQDAIDLFIDQYDDRDSELSRTAPVDQIIEAQARIAALEGALRALIDAVGTARTAEDNLQRELFDDELWDECQDAQATLIIRENEARAALDGRG